MRATIAPALATGPGPENGPAEIVITGAGLLCGPTVASAGRFLPRWASIPDQRRVRQATMEWAIAGRDADPIGCGGSSMIPTRTTPRLALAALSLLLACTGE